MKYLAMALLLTFMQAVTTGPDYWNRAYVIFTGLLVIVGAVGVFFAVKTLRAIQRQGLSMRRQTTLLRKSVLAARTGAKAALLNAQAVINAERPWILITPIGSVGSQGYSFEATNHGRTPAEIISEHATFDVFENEGDVPILPEEERFILAHRPMLLPMKELVPIKQFTPNRQQEPPSCIFYSCSVDAILGGQGDERRQEIRQSLRFLMIYGIVIYADVLTQDRHYARFCYRWNPNGSLILAGPDGANKHT